MTRIAAVDCGTNSLRLLIVDIDLVTGQAVEVERRTEIVRLGQGVDRTGVFAAEALTRTFATLDVYAGLIGAAGVDRVRFVATSAARDVSNKEALLAGVLERLGVPAEIVSGEAEALLTYDGATRGLRDERGVVRPVVVADFGGGSTELVGRAGDSGPVRGHSLDIGSVRITERHLHDDPPTPEQVRSAVADIEAALDHAGDVLADVGTLVAVSGTATTMAAIMLGLPTYDRRRVQHARLPTDDLTAAVDRVVAMSVAERLCLASMHPGRADVIGAGALVLAAVVRRARVDATIVSEHDILDGVAWSLT